MSDAPDYPAGLGGAVLSDWTARMRRIYDGVVARVGASPHFALGPDPTMADRTVPDWGAFPIRIQQCLGRQATLEVLDWRTSEGDQGRKRMQEEYLEWRTVKDAEQRVVRFEMTTESPEAWRSIAAQAPLELLELVRAFARDEAIDPSSVFGPLDAPLAEVPPDRREQAFVATMLGPAASIYNNGRQAICCLRQPSNDLASLVELAIGAAHPFVVLDDQTRETRPANAADLIPHLGDAAQAGRSSDPVLVERFARLALEGRRFTVDPLAVLILDVETNRFRTPDGAHVPAAWFVPSRSPEAEGDQRTFPCQRLVLEVPPDEGFVVGDLVDVATEAPIHYGGQIADLVRLGIVIKTTPAGVVDLRPHEIPKGTDAGDRACEPIRTAYRELRAAGNE